MPPSTPRVGSVGGHALKDGASSAGWKLFAPVPDPVGFGGMFAGALNGRLVAGGGSQFRDKPLWLHGEKVFSDRWFTLADPAGPWLEQPVRLPFKAAHFACASTAHSIYIAGGVDSSGCLRETWEISARGDEDLVCARLPDLPTSNGYAAAAMVGDRLYVAGGQHTATIRVASVETWSLDLKEKSAWRREPDLPGAGVFLAAAAGHGDDFYLIGGVNFDAEGKSIQSAQVWRLATARGRWERVADLPEPRVGAASPCAVVDGGKIFLIGGYARSFPGAPREHPGFSPQTYRYDIAHQRWENGPLLPKAAVTDRDCPGDTGPAPMIAAPCVVWLNHAVVISGEVRASTRTPAVLAWPLEPAANRLRLSI
jgi:N-acetylneuraminate epimerase